MKDKRRRRMLRIKTFKRSQVIVITLVLLLCLTITGCSAGTTGQTSSEAGTTEPKSELTTEVDEADITPSIALDEKDYFERLEKSVDAIREITDFKPSLAVVLGSGLGHFAENENLEIKADIPYEDIPGFPRSTVKGHNGHLIFGVLEGKNLVMMQGRIHFYEGYDIQDVVYPLRVMHLLGAETVILTNAVGAINEDFHVGDFVAVEDHIASFVHSPLVGENISGLGDRFVGMVDAYDPDLRELVLKIGKEENITVQKGVYLQVPGPQYETPAEIRMFRSLGADTVGMSTAVETIAARHMDMRVCCINSVTNMAAGIEEHDFSHEGILQTADEQEEKFTILLTRLISEMK